MFNEVSLQMSERSASANVCKIYQFCTELVSPLFWYTKKVSHKTSAFARQRDMKVYVYVDEFR